MSLCIVCNNTYQFPYTFPNTKALTQHFHYEFTVTATQPSANTMWFAHTPVSSLYTVNQEAIPFVCLPSRGYVDDTQTVNLQLHCLSLKSYIKQLKNYPSDMEIQV